MIQAIDYRGMPFKYINHFLFFSIFRMKFVFMNFIVIQANVDTCCIIFLYFED